MSRPNNSSAIHWRSSVLVVALSLAGICGCGLELYEKRLQATTKLYEHFQTLKENLLEMWVHGPISLRVPLQFTEIPAPVAPPAASPTDPAAEPPPLPPDTRKPTQPPLELLGLRAAFKADLTVDGGGKQPGFIYVLSNYDLPREQKDIHGPLAQEISTAFHVNIEANSWKEETYPERPTDAFPGVSYKTLTVTPPADVEGPPRRVSIYLYTQGEVQIAIVFVLPQKIDGSEHLLDRIPLCLETLNVSADQISEPQKRPADAPAGATTDAPPAGAPAGKSGF